GRPHDVVVRAEEHDELHADEQREDRHQQAGGQRPVQAAQPGGAPRRATGSGGASRRNPAPVTADTPSPKSTTQQVTDPTSTFCFIVATTAENAASAEASSGTKPPAP